MKTVVLNIDTVNGLLGYLGKQPYVEVAEIISRINRDVSELNAKKVKDERVENTDSGQGV
ncbi:MAG: hypothetical protein LBK22_00270 [Tannerella sp.]|jgi:hypothetical protein|nr:hypothetical protein [Tannerella sp.]